jgi:hypothetical protein
MGEEAQRPAGVNWRAVSFTRAQPRDRLRQCKPDELPGASAVMPHFDLDLNRQRVHGLGRVPQRYHGAIRSAMRFA